MFDICKIVPVICAACIGLGSAPAIADPITGVFSATVDGTAINGSINYPSENYFDGFMSASVDGNLYSFPITQVETNAPGQVGFYSSGLSFYINGLSGFGNGNLPPQTTPQMLNGGNATFTLYAGSDSFSGPVTSYTFAYGLPGSLPEPGTWATMLLGFGVMGLAFRRRPLARAKALPTPEWLVRT